MKFDIFSWKKLERLIFISSFFFLISQNPKHHLSFAWCVGNKKKELDRIITNYNHCHMVMEGDCCQSSEVVAKIGNMKFSYPLKNT